MKQFFVVLAVTSFFVASAAFAADKAYQVTGPVLELDANKIVVQKGKDKWELLRTPDLKLADDVKVGSKVTIAYKMTATSVESKAAKAAKPAKEAKTAKDTTAAAGNTATTTKHTAKTKTAKEPAAATVH
jgi:hypothetical protein